MSDRDAPRRPAARRRIGPLPVRPDLRQLRVQAKELLRSHRRGEEEALALFRDFHPDARRPARLADAQLVLARAVGVRSWPRLVQACRVVDAIWEGDLETLRGLVERHPHLRDEPALGREGSSWGPPMSYAANLGRDAAIELLHALGATDHAKALDRAALQGRTGTARRLHALMGSPPVGADALEGPAYTLSVAGTRLMLELGAPVRDGSGRRLAPVDVVLETDSRRPAAKHAILEAYVAHGLDLPDTPTMALHRGRIDLLEGHLARDPGLLDRRFAHEEIYPPSLGCHDEVLATQGTPLAGTTLLHMAVDYDEEDVARWLLDRGADPNAPALVDARGFGGHTPLFGAVVSQPNYWMNRDEPARLAAWAGLLLDHGADPNARASIRKQLHPGYGARPPRDYLDVTPLSWGRCFEDARFVSAPALEMIEARGGAE